MPTKKELLTARGKTVADVIAKDLKILFCGINPGLYTAYIGHHFGRPGNRFWKALYDAGFTFRQLKPAEERELLKLGYGITNIYPRATISASEISKKEFIEQAEALRDKINIYKPRWIAFLGIEAYRKTFNKIKVNIGKQEEKIGDTNIWVLPNTSGLNAHYTPTNFAILFRKLRMAIDNH